MYEQLIEKLKDLTYRVSQLETWESGVSKGTTAQRPNNINIGYQYYDTTLNLPIWYNGTDWTDATGNIV